MSKQEGDKDQNSLLVSLQEYIKSGEYFTDSRRWYNTKYLVIATHRSVMIFLFMFALVSIVILGLNINSLLPMIQTVRYSISTPGTYQTAVQITPANQQPNDPAASIAGLLIKNYVINREAYDYDMLKKQYNFVKTNSTRIVFRKFFNTMNIDSPDSPVLKYQRFTRRSVNIISIEYPDSGEAVVVFESIAKLTSGDITENARWEATINFEIDKLNLKAKSGSRFNFAVTNYKTRLLQDKLKK